MILTICFVILLIPSSLLFWVCFGDFFVDFSFHTKENFKFIGCLILILDIIIGFGFACCLIPVKTKTTQITDFQIVKTRSALMVEYGNGQTAVFTDAATYNNAENSNLYLSQDVNSYGLDVNKLKIWFVQPIKK